MWSERVILKCRKKWFLEVAAFEIETRKHDESSSIQTVKFFRIIIKPRVALLKVPDSKLIGPCPGP